MKRNARLIAALVTVIGLLGSCSDSNKEPAVASGSESSQTTVSQTSTSTSTSSTQAPPSTTTTVLSPGTGPSPFVPTAPAANGAKGPVIGEKRGWHLTVIGQDGIAIVDLDTGEMFRAPLPDKLQTVWTIDAFDGGAYVSNFNTGNEASVLLVDVANRQMRTLPDGRFIDFLSTRTDRFWVRSGAEGWVEYDASGTGQRRYVPKPSFDAVPRGAIGDSLIVFSAGRIFVVDPQTNAASEWATGTVSSVVGGRIIWRECSATLRCRSYAGTLDDRYATPLPLTRAICGVWYEGYHDPCDGASSRFGDRYLAGYAEPGAPIALYDLTDGSSIAVDWPTDRRGTETGDLDGVRLSPDGSFAFVARRDGTFTAIDVATGQHVSITVPNTGALYGFAVG